MEARQIRAQTTNPAAVVLASGGVSSLRNPTLLAPLPPQQQQQQMRMVPWASSTSCLQPSSVGVLWPWRVHIPESASQCRVHLPSFKQLGPCPVSYCPILPASWIVSGPRVFTSMPSKQAQGPHHSVMPPQDVAGLPRMTATGF